MGALENEHIYGIQIRESANDGSDFTNPDADYRVAFLGEDGLWHVKDSSGTVTSPYASSGSGDFNAGALRIPVGTSALTTTEGYLGWQSTTERVRLYDGQRERAISSVGWAPFAFPMNYVATAAFTTTANLAANGGSVAMPVIVASHMLLQAVSIRNRDTASARSWGWDLYEQRLNNGNSGENTLDRVAASTSDESFTASAVSSRTIDAGSAPVYLAPGLYWLVVQNRHATNTFAMATTAVSAEFGGSIVQTKTTTNPNGSTLDFVAATWTKDPAMWCAKLRGRVFGETAQF